MGLEVKSGDGSATEGLATRNLSRDSSRFRALDPLCPLKAQQSPSDHEQIGERARHEQALFVLLQAAIANLVNPKMRLITPKACSIRARTRDLVRFFARSTSLIAPRWR